MDGYRYDDCMESIITAVRRFTPKASSAVPSICICCPSDAPRLLANMRAYDCAFLVRRVLEHLQIDESLPFRFRVDHKLVQGILLRSFVPSSSLKVIGFAKAFKQAGNTSVDLFLQALFPQGFVIKDTYGYASGRNTVLNSAATIPQRAKYALESYTGTAESEMCFVQERFPAVREYRVHTLGRDVIPTLTFRTHGSVALMGELERDAVNSFVTLTIGSMPAALIEGSLCGWDVGVNEAGVFKVFEVNYGGLHPVHEPGFHCSAYLQSYIDNTLNLARLMHFVAKRHGVQFVINLSPASNPVETDAASILYQVDRWRWLLELADKVSDMWSDSYKTTYSVNDKHGVVESIRGVIYSNAAGPTERRYCQYLDWLKKMTDDLR